MNKMFFKICQESQIIDFQNATLLLIMFILLLLGLGSLFLAAEAGGVGDENLSSGKKVKQNSK